MAIDVERDKALELLTSYETAMLVTHDHQGLEARPMQIASVEPSGRMWFFTDARSRKVEEIRAEQGVLVVCQDDRSSYLSIQGTARIVRDTARMHELWKEPYQVWFPEGVDDPSLVLIVVDPTVAEYWDNHGARKLRYMFQAAAAYVTGTRPQVDEGDQHGKTAI